jgi:hypothetical protein
VVEILRSNYQGSLSGLLKNRLGIELSPDIEDEELDYVNEDEEELERLSEKIRPMEKLIFEHSAREHESYIRYIYSLVPPEEIKNAVVVDVGYAGTIQYFLSKVLGEKVSGLYLASFNALKPLKLGCEAESMYKPGQSFTQEIHRTQIFLEIALTAPYGQLLKFDDNAEPIYKKEDVIGEDLKKLQAGIVDYCRMRARLSCLEGESSDRSYESVYGRLLHGRYMNERINNMFELEDDYCSDRVLKFNVESEEWE